MPLVKIGKAAESLGVSVQTLRKWEDSGELVPDRRSESGVCYYDVGKILGLSAYSDHFNPVQTLTHKDRLLRFGSELIFALCEIQNIEIVIIQPVLCAGRRARASPSSLRSTSAVTAPYRAGANRSLLNSNRVSSRSTRILKTATPKTFAPVRARVIPSR
jgi:hypothetical protein